MNCFRQASSEPDAEKKRELLSFYVIGAGLTGVEMAGELAEYIPILCDFMDIDRRLVSLTVVDALSKVVPNLPDKPSTKIRRRLEKMGVEIRLDTKVARVGEGFIDLARGEEVSRHIAGSVIWTAGIEGAAIAQAAAGTLSGKGRGRVVTDGFLRSVDDKRVFVVGDNLFYIPEGGYGARPADGRKLRAESDIAATIYTPR